MKIYNLFISHSWNYNHQYYNIESKLAERSYFGFKNYSIPEHDPVHSSSDRELKEAIESKIKYSSVVLVLAGVYSTHSKWINIEIAIAIKYNKPIIAIDPWGSKKTSANVKDSADRVVKWQVDKIVEAIRELA